MLQLARRIPQHLESLARAHCVFRPAQVLRRVTSDSGSGPGEARLTLPWGWPIAVNPRDPVGQAVQRRGIFDLLVCETLLRLADPGEVAVDAGANIGHMTSLLAYAVGASGRVIAFEPHPEVFSRLERNATLWMARPDAAAIELHRAGVSDADGDAVLATDVFEINQGSPTLEPLTRERGEVDRHTVRTERLDTALAGVGEVGVMKIDIEGHELSALHGAAAGLAAGRVRDIVFEEQQPPPTPVTRLLLENGYALMQLGESIRGPLAGPLGSGPKIKYGDDRSLLATLRPERAIDRLRARGWAVYGIGPAARLRRAAAAAA